MDYILDVIVLRSELDKINLIEEYFEWGDEKYIINDVSEFVKLFCVSLSKLTPQGIAVSKK